MLAGIFENIAPEYEMAWSIYLACAVFVFLVAWRWTRWIRPILLKHLIRFAGLGAMLIPMPHTTVDGLWVPAIGIAVVSGIIEGAEVAQRGLRVVGFGAVFGAAFGLIPGIIETLFRRKYPEKPKPKKGAQATEAAPEQNGFDESHAAADQEGSISGDANKGKVEPRLA